MAAPNTLAIALAQVNRLFISRQLINLKEFQICNVSSYGNKNNKFNKKKSSKPFVKGHASRKPKGSRPSAKSIQDHAALEEEDFDDEKKKGNQKVSFMSKEVIVCMLTCHKRLSFANVVNEVGCDG